MKRLLFAVVSIAVLSGCGTDSSTKVELESGSKVNVPLDGTNSVYFEDANSTSIGAVPDGYEFSLGENGDAILRPTQEQASTQTSGSDNQVITVSCDYGSCPIDIDIDASDSTHNPVVVEQPKPVVVEQPTPIIVEQPTPIVTDNNYTSIKETNNTVTTNSNSTTTSEVNAS